MPKASVSHLGCTSESFWKLENIVPHLKKCLFKQPTDCNINVLSVYYIMQPGGKLMCLDVG